MDILFGLIAILIAAATYRRAQQVKTDGNAARIWMLVSIVFGACGVLWLITLFA